MGEAELSPRSGFGGAWLPVRPGRYACVHRRFLSTKVNLLHPFSTELVATMKLGGLVVGINGFTFYISLWSGLDAGRDSSLYWFSKTIISGRLSVA
jgi:hypothetical protein